MTNHHGASIFWAAINPVARTLALALVATSPDAQPASKEHSPAGLVTSSHARKVDFGAVSASSDAHDLAVWVLDSGDNQGLPFVIIDKKEAKAFVFYADGRLRAATAVLLGSAIGDNATPGVGQKKLADILPEERTTPAGRFVASLDRNLHGKEILWVDYDTAISMHPVVTTNPSERRTQRLATPTALDNRISYGCINVPAAFFTTVLKPTFLRTLGLVYVMPEIKPSQPFSGTYKRR
jgi:hypothetical protein